VRIIHLRNDYKDLMSRIERGLHEYHASGANFRAQTGNTEEPRRDTAAAAEAATTHDLVETPFARVQSVTAASPAAEAGLRVGDSIRRFGDVNWLNHDKLSKIAELVQQNIGVSAPADHPFSPSSLQAGW
jgi:26S proteasome non-ATPase regulatory subunit 9